MKREEYLQQLELNLSSLTNDEKKEAIQYYSDYFEDADDDEKIMSELGSPEELAKTIVEKMANNLVSKEEKNTEENDTRESVAKGVIFHSFNKNDVRSLTLTFAAVEVVAISGKSYSIETRGLAPEDLNITLSSEGVLNISNNKRINFNFWSHDRSNRIIPRILLTLPEDAELNRLKVALGAGNFDFRDISLTYAEGKLEVGAGNLQINKINGKNTDLRCGMGNLDISGELKGRLNVDCGMGAVKININGNIEEYSYDAKVGLGELRINNEKKNVVGKYLESSRKDNHISVNCGMGSVNIKIQK